MIHEDPPLANPPRQALTLFSAPWPPASALDADLTERGIAFQAPADPLHDEAFVELLTRAYVHEPTVFEA